MQPSGSLTIVGVGIQIGHTSLEAIGYIKHADKVLYLATDPVTKEWLASLNSSAESLHSFYSPDKDRLASYEAMVEHILSFVRNGERVCVALYGHPGVFVYPSHKAIAIAKSEGFRAKMLPGVSAEDCLFADLGFDPAANGCQSFEATDFLIHERIIDPRSLLVLWQIGVIGDIGYKEVYNHANITVLVERLNEYYDLSHKVWVYEASRYVVCEPSIQHVLLGELDYANITPISTLCVPPENMAIPNLAVVNRLGIPESYIRRRNQLQDQK